MYDTSELEFIQVIPRQQGIFVLARYPAWCSKYSFLILPNGRVRGRTSSGIWLEVSSDLGSFVRTRVKYLLSKRSRLIY